MSAMTAIHTAYAEEERSLPEMTRLEKAEAALVLAALWGDPAEMTREDMERAAAILPALAPESCERFGNAPGELERIRAEQSHTFSGPVAEVSLEESVYKPWTTDPAHPFAGKTGLVCGEPAAHMAEVLAEFGLTVDPSDPRPPDHLAVLLEFLSFLIEQGSDDDVRSFCSDHFDWLEDLQRAGTEKKAGAFFDATIDATAGLIRLVCSDAAEETKS